MKKALLILFAAAALGAYGATMATKDYVDRSVNNLYTNVVDQVSNLFSTIDTDNFLPRSWTNNQDVVIGQGHSWIDGSWATAVGNNNAAMGTNATAIGSSSIARGTYATAVGTADALADYSIALGLNAQVLGRMSFAGGPYARAHGEYGSSVGYNSLSSNMFSVAIGPWAFAEGQQSVALGTYASAHSMDSVAIGAGAKSGDRNAATNFNDGCVSVAIGYQTEATNSGAVAIGPRWVRSGFFSQTLTGASAGAPYSIAIGGSVTTGAQNSVSIGSRAMASNNFAVVISASTNLDVNATVHHSHGEGTITFGVDGGLGDVYVGDRPLSDIIMNDGVVRRAEVYGTPTRWIDASGCVWEVSFSLSPWSFSGAGVANYSNLSVSTNEDIYVLLENDNFVDYGSELGFDLLDVHFVNAAVVATRSIVPSSTNIVGHVAMDTDIAQIAEDVVREQSLGGIYDSDLGVWWTPIMQNGALRYETNAVQNAADALAAVSNVVASGGLASVDAVDAKISTNNAAFVSAVLAVPIAGADAGDLAEISEYGGYGTVGAAILALIAGLAALKRRVTSAETALLQKASLSDLPYRLVEPGKWEFSGLPSGVTVVDFEFDGASWNLSLSDGDYGIASETDENILSAEILTGNRVTITATRASLPGHLLDRAGNRVVVTGDTTLTLPEANPGYLRDFLVRLEISGSTVPTITFAAPTGETIVYETDGDEFPVPDDEGDWLYSFTESCVAHRFAVSLKKVNTVAQGGS